MSPLSRRLVPAAIAVSLCLAVGACMASGNASSDAAKPPAPKAAPNLPSEASVDAVPTPEPQPMPSDRAADPNKPKAQVGEPVG
ncbi:hypothetical protein JTP77_043135, partial [Streptomyces sp. S9]|nr:hypothetical protein [Streptomyces sp. S9]